MHKLLLHRAPHPLMLECPDCTLKGWLIVPGHSYTTEAQAFADLQDSEECSCESISYHLRKAGLQSQATVVLLKRKLLHSCDFASANTVIANLLQM